MVNKKHVAISVIALFVIIGVASAYFLLEVSSKTSATNNSNMNMNNDNNTFNSCNTCNSSENEVTVIIQNGTFNPVNLTVKAGTNVTWINKDSNIEPMVTGNGFMSPSLTNGQSFSYIFNQAGSYPYYDMNHPYNKTLTGNIIVQ
jgi:plastocyanin